MQPSRGHNLPLRPVSLQAAVFPFRALALEERSHFPSILRPNWRNSPTIGINLMQSSIKLLFIWILPPLSMNQALVHSHCHNPFRPVVFVQESSV
jgi:hypothetical protein